MYQYSNSLIRQFPSQVTGNAAVGVQATVYVGSTGTLASLFESNCTTPKTNPVTTDSKGFYSFSVADGDYRIVFSSSQFATLRISVLDGAAIREGFDDLVASNTAFRNEQQAAYDSFVLSQGWDQIGTFTAGFTYTSPNQVGQDADGNWWRWNGSFPKVVTAGALPSSDANYKLVGDGVLRSDLSQADGASLVGYGDQTVEQQLDKADLNIFPISKFGGVDDYNGTTGTNNFQAVFDAFTELASRGGKLYFPKTATGVYFISGEDDRLTDGSGIELICDDGVSFAFVGEDTPLITRNIKVNREVKVLINNQNFNFYLGRQAYQRPSSACMATNSSMGSVERPKSLTVTSFSGYDLNDATGRLPVTLSGSDDQIIIPFSLVGQKNVAVIKAREGQEFGAITAASTGKICVGVVTVFGSALVEYDTVTNTMLFNKSGVTSSVGFNASLATRNQFNSALLSVKVLNNTQFSVCVNFISIGTFDADESITGAAFGGVGRTTNMDWFSPFQLDGGTYGSYKPIRILALGDSTSDPAVPCSQYDYMRQFLGAAGLQVTELNNLAVSGEGSPQQLARFNAIGDLARYDFCVAAVGINDIQGSVPFATYVANMVSMANTCKANGVKFVLSVPTMWYSQAEAAVEGQGGQSTSNNALGSRYRAAVIRAMEAEGAVISTIPMRMEGLITADLLSNPDIDPVLMDNIHPTAYGRMVMGYGHAATIVGLINPRQGKKAPLTQCPSRFFNANVLSGQYPFLRVEKDKVTFEGQFGLSGSYNEANALIKIDKEIANGTFGYYFGMVLGAGGVRRPLPLILYPDGNIYTQGVLSTDTNIQFTEIVVRQ